ncbi:GMC family oxidoreductase, partial [Mycobacterium montefiorense]
SDELSRRIALSHGAVQAGVDLGHPFNPDYNGARQLGVGYTQFNIVDGVRQDAFTSFVGPYLSDPRLTVLTNADVVRLEFNPDNAVERVVVDRDSREISFYADREVIVCAGTVNTVKLLHLSGLGPAADLEKHGIAVVADLPGVGANLQDHLISLIARPLRQPLPAEKGVTMLASIFSGAEPSTTPRFQFQFYGNRQTYAPFPANSMTIGGINLHPASRGFVELRSSDPRTPPVVQPNFLQASEDVEASLEAYEMARELINAKCLQPWLSRKSGVPSAKITTRGELLAALRTYTTSNFHPVGTCRMGIDKHAVVDPQLRIHGVTGLRIASAAVMPTITSGNTNAPAMMIGDRCGRTILENT